MHEAVPVLPFDATELDVQNFTVELLQQCSLYHLLSGEKLLEIRTELGEAFLETAAQFTRRASSSLPKQQAKRLYASMLYQADVFLMQLPVHAAVHALQTLRTGEILAAGSALMLETHHETLRIFREAYRLRLHIPIFGYRYVMERAFDTYVREYDGRFDARNCRISPDYPLLGMPVDGLKTQGVMWIAEYYTGILHENEFCTLFPESEIEEFLIRYARIYHCSYDLLPFNIAEVLLNNLLACAMVELPLFSLYLDKAALVRLQLILRDTTEQGALQLAERALMQYHSELPDPACTAYLRRYLPQFAQEVTLRAEQGRLERFLVLREA